MTYKEWIIGKNLKRFSKESFYRYYGKKGFNKIIGANYMRKRGRPIDSQAQEISYEFNPIGDGTEITEEDIIDFVLKYIKNPFTRKIKPKFDEEFDI